MIFLLLGYFCTGLGFNGEGVSAIILHLLSCIFGEEEFFDCLQLADDVVVVFLSFS